MTKVPFYLNNLYLEIKINDLVIQHRHRGETNVQPMGLGRVSLSMSEWKLNASVRTEPPTDVQSLLREMEYRHDRIGIDVVMVENLHLHMTETKIDTV